MQTKYSQRTSGDQFSSPATMVTTPKTFREGSPSGGYPYDQINANIHPYPPFYHHVYPYPLVYSPYGVMGTPQNHDFSRKRVREVDHGNGLLEFEDLGGPTSKRRAFGQGVVFRMIVPSKLIGRVIGKEGSRIRQIREETGATIKIADPIVLHEERVIIVSSASDEGRISNAEAALTSIAKAILRDNEDNKEYAGTSVIRLLIASSQVGCVIGVSGQTIEHLRNFSGAAVTILAPNQSPLCTSAHESDRVVQLSGDVPEILTALEQIGIVLRENPSTKVASIRSCYQHSSIPPNTQPPSGEYMTSELTISENFVGGLIGRNGYNISRIRNVSGATVKVTGNKGEDTRQIFFGGSPQQVATARMLVENYMYSQLVPQNIL